MTLTVIDVNAQVPYPVVVGNGAVDVLETDTYARFKDRAVVIISNPDVEEQATHVADRISGRVRALHRLIVPPGEAAKDLEVVARTWEFLASVAIDRSDMLIAVGGGATTDVAGFIAATWMRGVDVVHVPTTTAGMVDAAIGGKTAIDIAAGKNLVGAFHDPRAVICDLNFLGSLPPDEYRSGLAEVVKCGFIGAASILTAIEHDHTALNDHPKDAFISAINLKANVVAVDARENSLGIGRELLNYGHTFGHVLETLSQYTLRHGDGVSIGMVFAAEVSHALGHCSVEFVARHRRVLSALGLPISHDVADLNPALEVMMRDKKARAGKLRMILLRGVGDAYSVSDIDESILLAAFNATKRDAVH